MCGCVCACVRVCVRGCVASSYNFLSFVFCTCSSSCLAMFCVYSIEKATFIHLQFYSLILCTRYIAVVYILQVIFVPIFTHIHNDIVWGYGFALRIIPFQASIHNTYIEIFYCNVCRHHPKLLHLFNKKKLNFILHWHIKQTTNTQRMKTDSYRDNSIPKPNHPTGRPPAHSATKKNKNK